MKKTLVILAQLLISAVPVTVTAQVMCPDGSFVARGPCTLCPDGSFIGGGGRCQLAPDGSFIPEQRIPARRNPYGGYTPEQVVAPQMAPDGTFHPGGRPLIMCPDGSFVVGTRCVLMPNGGFIGQ